MQPGPGYLLLPAFELPGFDWPDNKFLVYQQSGTAGWLFAGVFLHHVGFHIDRHSRVARSTGKVLEQNVHEAGRMMPLRFFRAFQKQANSEVQKPTGVRSVFRFFFFFLADLWRDRTLLNWVQKVVVCDLWLVNFDPFCVFLCFKIPSL